MRDYPEVRMVLDGREYLAKGTYSSIRKAAADKLNCGKEDVVLKIRREGRLVELLEPNPAAWRQLTNEIKKVFVSTDAGSSIRKASKKRKPTAYEERRRAALESDHDSSYDTPPRPSAVKKSRSSDGSRGYAGNANIRSEASRVAGSSTIRLSTADAAKSSSRRVWTPKEDKILWDNFEALVASMPDPNPVYTAAQKEQLFQDISRQAFAGKRSASAIQSQLGERIREGARRGKLSLRHKAVFPFMTANQMSGSRQNLNGDSSYEDKQYSSDASADASLREVSREEIESDEESSDSSGSEYTPSDYSRLDATSRPAAIRDYNPFASSSTVPSTTSMPSGGEQYHARSYTSNTQRPAQIHVPAATSSTVLSSLRTLTDTSLPTGIGENRPLQRGTETNLSSSTPQTSYQVRVNTDSTVGTFPRRATQGTAPVTGANATPLSHSAARPTAQSLPSQVGNLNIGGVSPRQETRQETGQDSNGAIVIKDESDDERMDEVTVISSSTLRRSDRTAAALGRAGSVKREHQTTRESIRGFVDPFFPIQNILSLPPTDWASTLATHIKSNALQGVTEPLLRLEILVACFDEFFYFSYRKINDRFSVQRATIGVALLFLDLYHAFTDVDEVQQALTELFYDRIFSPGARGPGAPQASPQEWPTYDLCAALSLLLPCRPTWLLTLIFQRCDHFHIDEVPPPVDKVNLIFFRLQLLLQKLNACQDFIDKKEADLKLLCKSIHQPFVDSSTLSNLQAFHRQARLTPMDKASTAVTLADILRHNSEATIRETMRKEEEDRFVDERLLLFSSPYQIGRVVIDGLIRDYSLSMQIKNGPSSKKFETTRETWHLWILQFRDNDRKKEAISRLRDRTPNQDVQILDRLDQTHSMCSTIGQDEQKKWHELRCNLHLHRQNHWKCVKRIKVEPAPVQL
jgi:hypothetical protein